MKQIQSHGPLGRRVVESMLRHRHGRVVDLRAFAEAKRASAQMLESVRGEERFRDLAPAHAIYVFMQNHASLLCELISQLPELTPLVEPIERAEEEYMPSGPPMSPLTGSYFTTWAMFDASAGPRRETFGTCLLDLGAAVRLDPEFLRLLRVMQDSRMGLFVHERADGDVQVLRELVTGDVGRFLVPSGYVGRPGEVWYVRALPPPAPHFEHGVVFTTPYVMHGQGEKAWEAFLARTLPKVQAGDERAAYASLMKWGLEPRYWHEYVLEAYAGHETEVVYLTGLPDVAGSRPHASDFAPENFSDAIAAVARDVVGERDEAAPVLPGAAVRAAAPRVKPRPTSAPDGTRTAPTAPRNTGEARHRFLLNPYRDARFTRCPMCNKPTKQRKFALAVHIDPGSLVAQGLTCRYCPDDDLIIVHQDVLEAQLADGLADHLPGAVGRPYLVLGTFDRDVWRRGLEAATPMQQALPALHPFREVLKVHPARWERAPE